MEEYTPHVNCPLEEMQRLLDQYHESLEEKASLPQPPPLEVLLQKVGELADMEKALHDAVDKFEELLDVLYDLLIAYQGCEDQST